MGACVGGWAVSGAVKFKAEHVSDVFCLTPGTKNVDQ